MTDSRAPTPGLHEVVSAFPFPAIALRRGGVVAAVNDRFLEEFAADDAYSETVLGARLDELEDSLDATVIEPLRGADDCERLVLRGALLWRHGARQAERFDATIARIDAEHALVTFRPAADDEGGVAERRRLKRLECLGMAASGVAHDLNNHLAAAMNVAELLGDELGPDSPHTRALEIIRGSSREAAALARKLLLFAGRGQPEVATLDLESLIGDASLLVRHELPRDGRILYEYDPGLEPVVGDANQVQHATLLLLLHSAKRLGPAGMLRVRTRAHSLAAPGRNSFGRILPAGDYVALEFETPAGPSEIDPHGDDVLLQADALAADHGGGLLLERVGNVQRVSLLLALPQHVTAAASAARDESANTRMPTVLIVDDDPMVRDVAVAMLGRIGGYRVVLASGGGEAIGLVRSDPSGFDLVLLDFVLGDMSGTEVLTELRRIVPSLPVVVVSGFGPPESLPPGLTVDATLDKPYTLAQLGALLEQVLPLR
jgi:two-component system cell cycle sensor histidine kinase/response regulator CckA